MRPKRKLVKLTWTIPPAAPVVCPECGTPMVWRSTDEQVTEKWAVLAWFCARCKDWYGEQPEGNVPDCGDDCGGWGCKVPGGLH